MTYCHACPTMYYVGPSGGSGSFPGFIFAEFPEGRGAPRYLFFASVLEAEAHAVTRRASYAERGVSYALVWGEDSPTVWEPVAMQSLWPRMEELMPDAPTDDESGWFADWARGSMHRRAA